MSFKKYVDELREKSPKNAEEACIRHIQRLICTEIEVHPHIKAIVIEYDDIFTSNMHTIVKNYLIKEGFKVENNISSVEYIGEDGMRAHSNGICILLDDLV
jgi:hypothetical protein